MKRLVVALAVVIVVVVGEAAPSSAQTGCASIVNGVPTDEYSGWRDPLVVDGDSALAVIGRSPTPVSEVSVRLLLPLASVELWRRTVQPGTTWSGEIPIRDVARLSNGLHHVEVAGGPCTVSMWVEVQSAAPLTTPVAITGIVLLAAGLANVVRAALGRRSGGRRALSGAIGGAAAGGGALLVSHQLGLVPLTTEWIASWLAVPGVASSALNLALGRARPSLPSPMTPMEAAIPAVPSTPSPPAPAFPSAAPPPHPSAAPPPPPPSIPPPSTPSAPAPVASSSSTGPVLAPPVPPPAVEPPLDLRDPPRSAFAHLEGPESTVVGQPFSVGVGLSPVPVPGVAGPELVRPSTSVGAYDLTVQLVADGFTFTGEARFVLRVTADDPYPVATAVLTADVIGPDVAARSIQAIYSVDGQTIGFAVRPIAVVARADLIGTMSRTLGVELVTMGVPVVDAAPDLTIRIVHGVDAPGRLLWTVESPHADVVAPGAAAVSDIGDSPEVFARKLISGVGQREGTEGLDEYLRGAGLTIADHVPIEVTDALAAAAAAAGDRPITVFLLSEEPYVPWELAVVEPLLRPGAPPYLAAQVELGRWVLGQRRPTLPPPLSVDVAAMAVIGGVYDGAAPRLLEAEAEAKALTARYGAIAVDAVVESIIDCLGGRPTADVLHFAMHGVYDSTAMKEGLVLLDGTLLDPLQVKGAEVDGMPFVFLNACQVGSGNELLGDYAGVAQSFLYAGAAAVIAPLWSVSDVRARELALAFYEATLEGGGRPAAVLREARAAFDDDPTRPVSATHLAYQFFGHPGLKLTRSSGGRRESTSGHVSAR